MPNALSPINIPLSKSKLLALLAGSLLFVLISAWMMIYRQGADATNHTFMLALGIIGILVFGICAVFIVNKLRDQRPGLIIDETGITDNTSGVAAGPVAWNEILEIRSILVSSQRLIMIMVSDPEQILERETNRFKRSIMKMNYSLCGSPVCITANTLKIEFDSLFSLLNDHLERSRH